MMGRIVILLHILFIWQIAIYSQTNLQVHINALLKEDFLKTSEVGITVYDLTAGRSLYAYQDRKLYRPASVEKLITSITALDAFGINHRFTTSLCYTGIIEEGNLKGDLYVIGGFDSEFDDESMNKLVDVVVSSGIKKIEGSLFADISMTDSLYWGSGWSWDDTPSYFQPYLSPLMYCKGYVEVTATPSLKDSLANLSVYPVSSFYSIANYTRSKNSSAGKFNVTRNWLDNGNRITVNGCVNGMCKERVNIFTSKDFFMHTFSERLKSRDVLIPEYSYAECPSDSTVTSLNKYSHTMSDVMTRALKRSDNLSAEAIFYHLAEYNGKRKKVGSRDGIKTIHKFIRNKLELNPNNYNIADGSGVSLYNYISPELLLACLKYAYSNLSIYEPLFTALPVAGVDGTLRNRMKQGKAHNNVRAKTGSVTSVYSLAGYLKAANGHMLAFVIINQNVLDSGKARMFQDRLCEELCK